MIVVALIGFLAAVAMPSYQSSVRKARRADARSALVTTAQLMERYSTEHAGSGYSTATISTLTGPSVVVKPASDNGYYLLSLANLTATTFTLRAAPQGAQAADGCATFTLDELGVRGVSGGTLGISDCW
jgi:Tfp pilus assembly protein PilE